MKYRKRPVVIEAVQFVDDSNETIFALEKLGLDPIRISYEFEPPVIIIVTPEGETKAKINDFIIRGIKGEFYPCQQDIFEATYELVE